MLPSSLGPGDYDNAVYEYLLSASPSTISGVCAGMRLEEDQARAALSRLESAGFVYQIDGGADGPHYAATAPSVVDAAILRQLADLREAHDRVTRLAARYRAAQLEDDVAGAFELVRGAGAISERANAMLASARIEALNMARPPVIDMHLKPPRQDIRGRIILDKELFVDSSIFDAIHQTGADHEIRVHTMVPTRMVAVDRTAAMLPLHQAGDSTPIVIALGKSAMLDSVLALFGYVWETAVTLHHASLDERLVDGPGHSPITTENRRLLSLLLAGMTDQAIASHYNVSVRTVERRIRAMMDAAQVRTRTQLAWEAARQQWL